MSYTKNTSPNYFDNYPSYANCGSFAFNIREWYNAEECLLDGTDCYEVEEWIQQLNEAGYNDDEITTFYTDRLVEQILFDFENEIEEICSIEQFNNYCFSDYELIAFRGFCTAKDGVDWDFHFKVFRNGEWMEKMGTQPVRFCTEDDWDYTLRSYTSNTVYFVHKIA